MISRRLRLVIAGLGLAGCSLSSLVDVDPASTVVDPATVSTAAGAAQLYNFAIATFATRLGGHSNLSNGLNNFIVATALFTDELLRADQSNDMPSGIDERTGQTGGTNLYGLVYSQMHAPRTVAGQAREALRLYAPGSEVRQAEMLALEAMTVVYFGEAWCSGIPLTIVPLKDEAIPTAGLTTTELFERAIVMFDSAIVLAGDSVRVGNLARVGMGRALLNLGRYTEAAAAVTAVPTDYQYLAEFSPNATRDSFNPSANELGAMTGPSPTSNYRVQVVNNEGGNGLVWSTDPRPGILTNAGQSGAMLFSAKYSQLGGVLQSATTVYNNPIRVADGLEARLIEAEGALSASNASWLTTLNTLRSTCIGTAACAPVPGMTGASLPALADPGTTAAQVDMVMRERAMWLYLTGHRQGDLRRLVRQYGRAREALWPTGTYVNNGFAPNIQATSTNGTSYGSDVVFTPAASERQFNPLYQGCVNLDP